MINVKTRNEILQRDGHTCQACGAGREELRRGESMCVGVIARNDKSVTITALDWKTLCPDCDEGIASATLLPRMNARQIIGEFRQLADADKKEVVASLLAK